MSTQVLILGHSFVKRFEDYLQLEHDERLDKNLNLPAHVKVMYKGTGGRTVPKLEEYDLPDLLPVEADIILVEIGSNDLAKPHIQPLHLQNQILNLVRQLKEITKAKSIIVCQILPRSVLTRRVPTYNTKVFDTNELLQNTVNLIPYAKFWNHVTLHRARNKILCSDGVHLNSRGQYLLYKSYSKAILQTLRKLRLLDC